MCPCYRFTCVIIHFLQSGLGTTPTIGVQAADAEEAPTDAAANEESSTDEITTVLEDLVRTSKWRYSGAYLALCYMPS